MTVNIIFCSPACELLMNRSFQKCPKCKNIWKTNDDESKKYYCNTAWVMCENCSKINHQCVVCEKRI